MFKCILFSLFLTLSFSLHAVSIVECDDVGESSDGFDATIDQAVCAKGNYSKVYEEEILGKGVGNYSDPVDASKFARTTSNSSASSGYTDKDIKRTVEKCHMYYIQKQMGQNGEASMSTEEIEKYENAVRNYCECFARYGVWQGGTSTTSIVNGSCEDIPDNLTKGHERVNGDLFQITHGLCIEQSDDHCFDLSDDNKKKSCQLDVQYQCYQYITQDSEFVEEVPENYEFGKCNFDDGTRMVKIECRSYCYMEFDCSFAGDQIGNVGGTPIQGPDNFPEGFLTEREIDNVFLIEKKSYSSCIKNSSYGIGGKGMLWVDDSCHATFAAQMKDPACGYRPYCKAEPSLAESAIVEPETMEYSIVCDSGDRLSDSDINAMDITSDRKTALKESDHYCGIWVPKNQDNVIQDANSNSIEFETSKRVVNVMDVTLEQKYDGTCAETMYTPKGYTPVNFGDADAEDQNVIMGLNLGKDALGNQIEFDGQITNVTNGSLLEEGKKGWFLKMSNSCAGKFKVKVAVENVKCAMPGQASGASGDDPLGSCCEGLISIDGYCHAPTTALAGVAPIPVNGQTSKASCTATPTIEFEAGILEEFGKYERFFAFLGARKNENGKPIDRLSYLRGSDVSITETYVPNQGLESGVYIANRDKTGKSQKLSKYIETLPKELRQSKLKTFNTTNKNFNSKMKRTNDWRHIPTNGSIQYSFTRDKAIKNKGSSSEELPAGTHPQYHPFYFKRMIETNSTFAGLKMKVFTAGAINPYSKASIPQSGVTPKIALGFDMIKESAMTAAKFLPSDVKKSVVDSLNLYAKSSNYSSPDGKASDSMTSEINNVNFPDNASELVKPGSRSTLWNFVGDLSGMVKSENTDGEENFSRTQEAASKYDLNKNLEDAFVNFKNTYNFFMNQLNMGMLKENIDVSHYLCALGHIDAVASNAKANDKRNSLECNYYGFKKVFNKTKGSFLDELKKFTDEESSYAGYGLNATVESQQRLNYLEYFATVGLESAYMQLKLELENSLQSAADHVWNCAHNSFCSSESYLVEGEIEITVEGGDATAQDAITDYFIEPRFPQLLSDLTLTKSTLPTLKEESRYLLTSPNLNNFANQLSNSNKIPEYFSFYDYREDVERKIVGEDNVQARKDEIKNMFYRWSVEYPFRTGSMFAQDGEVGQYLEEGAGDAIVSVANDEARIMTTESGQPVPHYCEAQYGDQVRIAIGKLIEPHRIYQIADYLAKYYSRIGDNIQVQTSCSASKAAALTGAGNFEGGNLEASNETLETKNEGVSSGIGPIQKAFFASAATSFPSFAGVSIGRFPEWNKMGFDSATETQILANAKSFNAATSRTNKQKKLLKRAQEKLKGKNNTLERYMKSMSAAVRYGVAKLSPLGSAKSAISGSSSTSSLNSNDPNKETKDSFYDDRLKKARSNYGKRGVKFNSGGGRGARGQAQSSGRVSSNKEKSLSRSERRDLNKLINDPKYDIKPDDTIFNILTKRYFRTGFPRLLKELP